MFSGGGWNVAVRWAQPLAAAGPVFGAGVDILGRAIVITGSGGDITAQWFDVSGSPLTGEFMLVKGFAAGSSTWFETSALIGGGVEVRRMDSDTSGLHAHALVLVQSGTASVQPAPQWMIDRADTRLQMTRGGKVYAVLPYGKRGANCSERLEIVTADGASCGAADYPIAAGSCDTLGLNLGEDGTVMQQLPSSMETTLSTAIMNHTCTWRFWVRALH